MNIHLFTDKIKGWVGERRQMLLYIGILAVSASLSFALGYMAKAQTATAGSVVIECLQGANTGHGNDPITPSSANSGAISTPQTSGDSGGYVASKNGSKFYPVDCGGAKRIKDGNKVFFSNISAAESAGYSAASGCN